MCWIDRKTLINAFVKQIRLENLLIHQKKISFFKRKSVFCETQLFWLISREYKNWISSDVFNNNHIFLIGAHHEKQQTNFQHIISKLWKIIVIILDRVISTIYTSLTFHLFVRLNSKKIMINVNIYQDICSCKWKAGQQKQYKWFFKKLLETEFYLVKQFIDYTCTNPHIEL